MRHVCTSASRGENDEKGDDEAWVSSLVFMNCGGLEMCSAVVEDSKVIGDLIQ